jgi:hypothetical protein
MVELIIPSPIHSLSKVYSPPGCAYKPHQSSLELDAGCRMHAKPKEQVFRLTIEPGDASVPQGRPFARSPPQHPPALSQSARDFTWVSVDKFKETPRMASPSGSKTGGDSPEDDPSPEASEPVILDISQAFTACLQLHKILLALLQRKPGPCDDADLAKVLNVYGRLRIWGEETRAILPPSSRGSLDDVLRKDPKLRGIAMRILQRLKRKVELGMWKATVDAHG